MARRPAAAGLHLAGGARSSGGGNGSRHPLPPPPSAMPNRGRDPDRTRRPHRAEGAGMSAERTVLTVSELTSQLRAVVEERFPAVWVEGEISNFRLYGSGHAYFTLKDEGAQLRAVLFRNRARRLRFEPGDGQHVLAFGSLEIYAQRGEYQLVVELLEPKGLGALQLAFEQLKQRLGAEGLFDQARKRPLPRFPRKIGVATSPSGAAIRDILRVIGRRFSGLHIVIAPCRVQGDGAGEEIAQAVAEPNPPRAGGRLIPRPRGGAAR